MCVDSRRSSSLLPFLFLKFVYDVEEGPCDDGLLGSMVHQSLQFLFELWFAYEVDCGRPVKVLELLIDWLLYGFYYDVACAMCTTLHSTFWLGLRASRWGLLLLKRAMRPSGSLPMMFPLLPLMVRRVRTSPSLIPCISFYTCRNI